MLFRSRNAGPYGKPGYFLDQTGPETRSRPASHRIATQGGQALRHTSQSARSVAAPYLDQGITMLLLMGRILAAGLFLFAGASHAQVVISQVYGAGGNSGATLRSDYIELHNNGTTAVNLSAWSVQYTSSAGTTWTRTNLTGSIAAGGYFLAAGTSFFVAANMVQGRVVTRAQAARAAHGGTRGALVGVGIAAIANADGGPGWGAGECHARDRRLCRRLSGQENDGRLCG